MRTALASAAPSTTLPATRTVREARDHYLAANGFSVDGYQAPTFQVTVFWRTWTLPNVPSRRRAVPLHDLHHVATGYGTDLVGEAETSAFELVGGIDSAFLWLFKLSAIAIGLCVAPRRIIAALRRARGSHTLYMDGVSYEAVLELGLGELRRRLGLPADGVATHEARRHRRAPVP